MQENYYHTQKLKQMKLKPGFGFFMLSSQETDRHYCTGRAKKSNPL